MKQHNKKRLFFFFAALAIGAGVFFSIRLLKEKKPNIVLSKAKKDEIQPIQSIIETTIVDAYKPFLSEKTFTYLLSPERSAESVAYLEKMIDAENAYCMLARIEGVPAGFILAHQLELHTVFIDYLFVLPKFQHKGVGRKLLESSLDFFGQAYDGTFYIMVSTHTKNLPALTFYKKMGFSIIKEYQELDYTGYILLRTIE